MLMQYLLLNLFPFYAFTYRLVKYNCGKLIQHCILNMLKYVTFYSCLFYYTPKVGCMHPVACTRSGLMVIRPKHVAVTE
jgi:hypothetical protein